MSKAGNCYWCNFTDAEKQSILFESAYWYVFLADKQDYIGRCVIVLKRHCENLSGLDLPEWIELKEIVNKLEDCFKYILGADLCNWSCLMNDFYKSTTPNPHLHIHVRPRYGKTVTINGNSYADLEFGHHYQPKKEAMLTDNDRKTLFQKIKNFLNQE
ncbi:MAG: HIT family protein [Acutalibacteraceae bacterium]